MEQPVYMRKMTTILPSLKTTAILNYFRFAELMTTPEVYMRRCFELAQKGKGNVAPNPMVGAVLVHNDRIIGEGWHEQYGAAHAEVNCIHSVKPEDMHLLPESTMYVSLEPCAHYGKTPPCALLLIEHKIKNVVVCNDDPFDAVKGKGLQLLKEARINTSTHLLQEEGAWLNRRFFCFHTHQRPYIILKWAQTKGGFFAPIDGSRLQMSNNHSKQLLHKWRTEEAAILVGTNTAIADNPQLTARLWQGRQPLRILIDRQLKTPSLHHIFDSVTPTWVINEIETREENANRFIKLDFGKNVLSQLLTELYTANIQSIIVEGGAQLLQNFIDAQLWDEARLFITPAMLLDGIKAPVLSNENLVKETALDSDQLLVYSPANSPYHYTSNLPL